MDQKLRVWWIPQIPMQPFYVDVTSVEEGKKIMQVLADYDLFQYEYNVKPDYCNIGDLQFFDPTDHFESPEGSWVDYDENDDDEQYPN